MQRKSAKAAQFQVSKSNSSKGKHFKSENAAFKDIHAVSRQHIAVERQRKEAQVDEGCKMQTSVCVGVCVTSVAVAGVSSNSKTKAV
jgi:hypothetical protein